MTAPETGATSAEANAAQGLALSAPGATQAGVAPMGGGGRVRVSRAPRASYDVSLDGTRFLVITAIERPQLAVGYGWPGEVRTRRSARR